MLSYAHVYHSHILDIKESSEVQHLNTWCAPRTALPAVFLHLIGCRSRRARGGSSFAHFIAFSFEYNLLVSDDVVTLKDVIARLSEWGRCGGWAGRGGLHGPDV